MIYVQRFFDVQHVGAILRNFIVLNQPITAQSIFLIYYITLWFHNALGRNLLEEDTQVVMFLKIYRQHFEKRRYFLVIYCIQHFRKQTIILIYST